MRSLTVRIFLSFWLIIALLIGIAAVAGYTYAERLRNAFENFEVSETAVAASAALTSGGRAGLEGWLRDRPPGSPLVVFVVDADGEELLGRRLPFHVARMIRRLDSRRGGSHSRRSRRGGDSPDIRLARPLTQIVGPDGATYRLVVSPKRNPFGEWVAERAGPAFLLLSLLVSGAVSFALARAIARPVQTFRAATVSIANGQLNTRVAASMRNRRDEIGMLAHDLDAMADKLQSASAQQTELTRNISHELRSPLARLRVALELARRQAGDLPEFARIDRETERLDALIGQILSYSRMESPADEARQLSNVGDLLSEAVDNANYESASRGVVVRMTDPCAIETLAYPAALSSAFENILRNAVRHSPDGAEIQVTSDVAANVLNVSIEDSGTGVADEALERLFEPFFRATQPGAEGSDGTGLGLAIARRAVENHGGTIAAANAPDGGLVVTVSLPIERNSEAR